jgi:hypothetical protein
MLNLEIEGRRYRESLEKSSVIICRLVWQLDAEEPALLARHLAVSLAICRAIAPAFPHILLD